MANKLAGQKAKFTKALRDYNATEDEEKRLRHLTRMAQVVRSAPVNGFSEAEVTGGQQAPDQLRHFMGDSQAGSDVEIENADQLVRRLDDLLDTSELTELGTGPQFVYAYGYRCLRDRLKVGRTDTDVKSRIIGQIGTSTPDRPALYLTIRTEDCRALEKTFHGILTLRQRKVFGGGDEWFLTDPAELLELYHAIHGSTQIQT